VARFGGAGAFRRGAAFFATGARLLRARFGLAAVVRFFVLAALRFAVFRGAALLRAVARFRLAGFRDRAAARLFR